MDTRRNEKERLRTENDIRLERPEKIERANAIIPCMIRAM